jgi:hypothetical protein
MTDGVGSDGGKHAARRGRHEQDKRQDAVATGSAERNETAQGVPDQDRRLWVCLQQAIDGSVDRAQSTAIELRKAPGTGGKLEDGGWMSVRLEGRADTIERGRARPGARDQHDGIPHAEAPPNVAFAFRESAMPVNAAIDIRV